MTNPSNYKSASKQLEDNLGHLETLVSRAFEYCKIKCRNEAAERTAVEDALAFASNRNITIDDLVVAFHCAGYSIKQSKVLANQIVEIVRPAPMPPTPEPPPVVVEPEIAEEPSPEPAPEEDLPEEFGIISLDVKRHPLPKVEGRGTGGTKYPLRKMAVGDSFSFPVGKIKAVSGCAYKIGQKSGRRYAIRRISETQGRCWRTE